MFQRGRFNNGSRSNKQQRRRKRRRMQRQLLQLRQPGVCKGRARWGLPQQQVEPQARYYQPPLSPRQRRNLHQASSPAPLHRPHRILPPTPALPLASLSRSFPFLLPLLSVCLHPWRSTLATTAFFLSFHSTFPRTACFRFIFALRRVFTFSLAHRRSPYRSAPLALAFPFCFVSLPLAARVLRRVLSTLIQYQQECFKQLLRQFGSV
jgi:hypothetical protein